MSVETQSTNAPVVSAAALADASAAVVAVLSIVVVQESRMNKKMEIESNAPVVSVAALFDASAAVSAVLSVAVVVLAAACIFALAAPAVASVGA